MRLQLGLGSTNAKKSGKFAVKSETKLKSANEITHSRWSKLGCTTFWGLKMKFNLSLKTLVLIQGVLIIGTIAIKIFYEWVGVEHILPLYSVLWIATWLEVSKNTK